MREQMNFQNDSHDRHASTFIVLAPIIVILAYILLGAEPVRNLFGFKDRGATGDFLAGIASPIVGYLSALIVYFSFQQQIRANKIQIEALSEEVRARKDESRRAYYKGYLEFMRAELNDLFYMGEIDRVGKVEGFPAFELFTKHLMRSMGAINNNENVLDTIFGIVATQVKLLSEVRTESEEIRKEVIEESFLFYSTKLGRGLNLVSRVSGNQMLDSINSTVLDIKKMFREYGYKV